MKYINFAYEITQIRVVLQEIHPMSIQIISKSQVLSYSKDLAQLLRYLMPRHPQLLGPTIAQALWLATGIYTSVLSSS
jgi:hypothetical protein